jgi:hypothetical protein
VEVNFQILTSKGLIQPESPMIQKTKSSWAVYGPIFDEKSNESEIAICFIENDSQDL